MTEQISHFCSITSCILLVKAPLNHLALLLPVLHPHHYKRYMGAAFASQLLICGGLVSFLTGLFHLGLSRLSFTLREFVIPAPALAVFELFGLQLLWIAARDSRSTLRVVTSLKNPKVVVFACYCCPKWGNGVWKQLPWAAKWIFPDDPRNLPPCSSTEHYLVNKRPYIGLLIISK